VELERFVAGDPAAAAVRAHVQHCATCRASVERIRDNNAFLRECREHVRDEATSSRVASEAPTVAGYEVLGEIHHGGQGVVYRARHAVTRRDVALKLPLRGSRATHKQQMRFEREVELVGGLRHPHIVTLYDGGTTPEGQPYFAMEYVSGVPLDQYAAGLGELRANLERVLRMFMNVCDAVQYAHQRGIIHRDLKPSNILVDQEGRPRVLDFGVAKLLTGQPDAARVTQTAEFVGTLAYAAPEQVQGDSDQIDTRTDVYALGMVLYELLTRRLPYSISGSIADIVQTITTTPPEPPSRVAPDIDDELETILLKALAKERMRRYQTVDALRRDVDNYLSGAPLDAKRDSRWYVLRKTVARHRLPAALAAAVVLLLVSYAVTMGVLYRKASAAEQLAERRRQAAENNARISSETLVFVDELIGAISPQVALGRDTQLLQAVLAEMTARVAHQKDTAAEVEAPIQQLIADAYLNLGMPREAEGPARRAVALYAQTAGEDSAESLDARQTLAMVRQMRGDNEGAIERYRSILAACRTQLPPDDPRIADTLHDLGYALEQTGEFEEAAALWKEALTAYRKLQGPERGRVARLLNNMGMLYSHTGDDAQAEDLFRRALDLYDKLYPDGHPYIGPVLSNLAAVLVNQSKTADAEAMLREALALHRKYFHGPHASTASTLANLAVVLQMRGAFDEAEKGYRDALEIHRALARESPDVGLALSNLAAFIEERGQPERALPVYQEALKCFETVLPTDHYLTANTRSRCGACLARLGRFAEAEHELLPAYGPLEATLGIEHRLTQNAVRRIVDFYDACGKPDDVARWREQLVTLPAD